MRLLANKLNSPLSILLLLAMGVVCALVSEWWWQKSLSHYTSASS
jgi:ABC-type uncharacterized transport system permease subunit